MPPTPSRSPAARGGSLRLALLGLALGSLSLASLPARAAAPSPAQLQALETALNDSGERALAALLEVGPGLDPAALQNRHHQLRQQFPDLHWQIRAGTPQRNGQPTVNVKVSGTRRQGGSTYRLDAQQQLALQSDGTRINGQTVLGEFSLLRSGENAPAVSLMIPDAVLTGQRYDVDVIFDEPLDGALVAGGIVALTPQQIASLESPSLELAALGGGGLFKTVQAPFSPGSQTWAVLLVHPKGIISATKRVRVVDDRAALTP